MAPTLRVLAGPSHDELVPITAYVNSDRAYELKSDVFEGRIAVYIKGFVPADADAKCSGAYFDRPERKGVTWSIQVQGRFLQEHSADDVLFGNTFDRPLNLPWGSGAALKFMRFVDPSLEHELASRTRPWALSPLVATMPYLAHARSDPAARENAAAFPPVPPMKPLEDDTAELHRATAHEQPARSEPYKWSSSDKRRAYFRDAGHRKEVVFGPEDWVTTDFCYGFMEFSPSLALRLPGGISFDLMKYWDGQPVRFVCCERNPNYKPGKKNANGNSNGNGNGKANGSASGSSDSDSDDLAGRSTPDGEPWSRIFWVVAIDHGDDDAGPATNGNGHGSPAASCDVD